MRRRSSRAVGHVAATLLLTVALAACGSGGDGATEGVGPPAAATGGSEEPGAGTEPAGTEPAETEPAGTESVGTEPVATVAPFGGGGGIDCEEAGGCVAYMYRTPEGKVFLCGKLRLLNVRLTGAGRVVSPAQPATTGTAATTVPVATEPEAEPVETAASRTVVRPACAPGATVVPAVGVNVDGLPDVQVSEDGSAWTRAKVQLSGRIVDGTFVGG